MMIITNNKKEIVSIGQYKILRLLDDSGFSFIYLVKDTKDEGKEYILKLLKSNKDVHRIDTEISILKHLNKLEHKICLHKIKKVQQSFMYIFDYANGGNLLNKIKTTGSMNEEQCFTMVKDIFKTLGNTQKQNIIHNNINPKNIVIKDDKYYLINWNISIIGESIKTLHIKDDDSIVAPEVYRGKFNKAVDIYSLGCSLYYALFGKNIYNLTQDTSFVKKMYSHIYLKPEISNNISNKMKYLLSRMLDKNPQTRANIKECEDIINDDKEYADIVEDNKNIEVDFTNKIDLYTKMAKDNIAYAQDILGLYYYNGYAGIGHDVYKAMYWYKEACSFGLSKAYFNLGLVYYEQKDYIQAFSYFEKASQNKHEHAYYYLGLIYENGFGLEYDLIKACEYYKKSAFYGCKKAHQKAIICEVTKEYL